MQVNSKHYLEFVLGLLNEKRIKLNYGKNSQTFFVLHVDSFLTTPLESCSQHTVELAYKNKIISGSPSWKLGTHIK